MCQRTPNYLIYSAQGGEGGGDGQSNVHVGSGVGGGGCDWISGKAARKTTKETKMMVTTRRTTWRRKKRRGKVGESEDEYGEVQKKRCAAYFVAIFPPLSGDIALPHAP
jgi:hypothetical protein